MGYVRMIRSGGLHFVSNSIRFVPNMDKDVPNFEQTAVNDRMSSEGVEAAKTLDAVVHNLIKNFSDGNNYFQVRHFLWATRFHLLN